MGEWGPVLIILQLLVSAAGVPVQPAGVSPDQSAKRPAVATPRPGSIARQLEAAARAEGSAAVPARQPADATGFPARRQALTPSALTAAKAQDQTGQVTSGTAFNPAMSVIPNLAYYNDSRNGEGGDMIGEADGFHRGEAEEGGHSHGSGLTPGFNLREVELALSGSVDPYFDAVVNLAIGSGEVDVEEAYVRTRRLPAGLQIKAGRFLSDIGYINRQHPHQWAFANQNLAHDLVLGGGLGETGVQVTWLPPLPVYLQLGAEALQGENEAIAAYVGPGDEHFYFSEASGPRLFTGFAKFSPDLGFNHALQVGGSLARARRFQEEAGDTSLEGHVWLVGLDAVYKYDSPKPHGEDDLVVQGEYLRRYEESRRASTARVRVGELVAGIHPGRVLRPGQLRHRAEIDGGRAAGRRRDGQLDRPQAAGRWRTTGRRAGSAGPSPLTRPSSPGCGSRWTARASRSTACGSRSRRCGSSCRSASARTARTSSDEGQP